MSSSIQQMVPSPLPSTALPPTALLPHPNNIARGTTRGTVELNNYLQKKGRATALSWEESTEGPEHAPVWICTCKIDGVKHGTGKGLSKQEARNAASAVAMKFIREAEESGE
ncbi:hypothetical protein M0805_003247 [Coniferiporia weirii]|nr:hypothetical protein M0805_003247 [Coniferiporia weirii]